MIELLLEAERALSFGQVERAESLYRQVAESDPKNSIAVVGLARVALERADDAAALTFARRALAIDPENEAARRLAQRMEEVITTRGDVLPPDAATAASPAIRGAAASPAMRGTDPARGSVPPSELPVPSSAGPRPRRSLLDRLRGR